MSMPPESKTYLYKVQKTYDFAFYKINTYITNEQIRIVWFIKFIAKLSGFFASNMKPTKPNNLNTAKQVRFNPRLSLFNSKGIQG